jgi:hypothetical protein
MIGVNIQGRLGNQLFQYAYARVLSKKFNTPFFLLNSKYFYAQKYFDFEVKRPVQYRLLAILFWLKNFFVVRKINEDQFKEPKWNIKYERNNCVYNGFYQSEQYLHSGVAFEIKEQLKVKSHFLIDIRDFVKNDKQNIVVHVRRTDYVTFGGEHVGGINLTLSLEYYQKALAKLPTPQCNILFLSDDMEFVKENFQFAGAIYADKNSEITDFQLIMQADYLILANSSFSWWGAFLNPKAQKVIAPKYWLGVKINKEYPVGVVSANWEAIV